MSNLKGKKVIMFQQRMWGKGIGRFLARKFYAEGCKLAALTSTKVTHDLVTVQPDAKYDLIVNHDAIYGDPYKYLGKDDITLKEVCEGLGVDSIWPLVWSLRVYVRSYKDKYYYGYKQNVPDEVIITYIKALYKSVRDFFDKFQPDIIVAPNFVSLHHMMFNLLGERRGVKMISLTDCKINGVSIFAQSYQEDKGFFYDRVDELNSGKADTANRERARQYIADFREKYKRPTYFREKDKKTWLQNFKEKFTPVMDVLRYYKNNPINPWPIAGVSPAYRTPRIILRDYFSHKKYKKFADNFNYYPLEKVGKFVYFPLQVQPETTVDVMAPFFSNQVEVARQLAMSLPDDYTLVVKEHPGMIGPRSDTYLEKIAKTVNVKLIDYRIPSEEVIKKTDLIISQGSTTLAEAAFYNKPAIQVGNLGTTLKLPNVIKHSDITTMTKKIKEVLKIDFNNSDYERKLENFIAAAYDAGYEVDYRALWDGREMEKMESLWQAYKNEVEKILNINNK